MPLNASSVIDSNRVVVLCFDSKDAKGLYFYKELKFLSVFSSWYECNLSIWINFMLHWTWSIRLRWFGISLLRKKDIWKVSFTAKHFQFTTKEQCPQYKIHHIMNYPQNYVELPPNYFWKKVKVNDVVFNQIIHKISCDSFDFNLSFLNYCSFHGKKNIYPRINPRKYSHKCIKIKKSRK